LDEIADLPLAFGQGAHTVWKNSIAHGQPCQRELTEELRVLKAWIDLNCPLWPDYHYRAERPL
jgi:hypothetical protein